MTEQEFIAKCMAAGMTMAGACGCAANVAHESAFRSDNVEDTYNNRMGVSDAEYVRQVDAGVRDFLAPGQGGFGLCQWTSTDRRRALYDYLKGHGKSIADVDGQIQFMCREMRANYTFVWNRLTHTSDPYEAGYVMCKFYEIPADTERQAQYRGNEARKIYERCSGTTPAVDPPAESDSVAPVKDWPPRMLCKGMSGVDVTVLQSLLFAHGYTLNAINGVFDESTDKAVRKFQTDKKLLVDGVVGNNTWRSLTAFTAVRR